MRRVAQFFYRLKRDDFVREFCVIGATDPHQYVETLARDGTVQRWDKRWEGDLLVFRPPDGYAGDQPLGWVYDNRLQHGVELNRQEHERLALNSRVSC